MTAITFDNRRCLDDQGFLLLSGFMSGELLAALRQRVQQLYCEEGDQAGAEFKQEQGSRRLANLVNKGALFQTVIADPRILELVALVLGEQFKLSSLNARSVDPHANVPQPLHCDMAAVADERGYWVCNTVWMLDDFTPDNGALRVVPGSHRWRRLPQDELSDPYVPHPDETMITGEAGSVIVMNAHLWHGGLGNRTGRPRTAVHAFYCRRDKPQQQYQKQLLDERVQRSLSPELRALLALDDPLNDQLSAAVTTRSGFLK